MIRIGEIVKSDENPLMIVSSGYEELVKKLSAKNYSSKEYEFLACLVISQTEKQYKKYLIEVMKNLDDLPVQKFIDDWQKFDFEIKDEDFKYLFTEKEFNLLQGIDLETQSEDLLFQDGLNLAFYHNKKKGMVYLRRLILHFKEKENDLNNLQKLTLYFVAAQLLDSWESSCIHLGLMLLNDWSIEDIGKWFNEVWPIYTLPKKTL